MCFLLLALNQTDQYPFVLAANRDEFYQRKTAQLHFWNDKPHILGGRDMEQSGTWMAVTQTGRFAAITNYREVKSGFVAPRSRGLLVTDYLDSTQTDEEFITRLQGTNDQYAGYNLIFGQLPCDLYYFSNRQNNSAVKLIDNTFALSNHLLDTPWPKVTKGKESFEQIIREPDIEQPLFELLKDESKAPQNELPDTGIDKNFEHLLSSIYIESANYGSRCSSVIKVDQSGLLSFCELTYNSDQTLKENPISFSLQL